jgi:capsular exopolysaccharide synthesis family protein
MSWFYEALQRAERSTPEKKTPVKTMGAPDGRTFLEEIEMLSSLSVRIPSESAAAKTQSAVATEVETEAPQEFVRPEMPAAVPAPPVSSNGFRHLRLPVEPNSRLIFHTGRHAMATEQFRLLRRKLSVQLSKGGVLLVTSPTTGDGKTLTSLNLCACLAEMGEPTLLIEADLRRPTMNKVLGCERDGPGLEQVLSDGSDPRQAIHLIEDLRLHVAMVANVPPDPSKLINGSGFRQMLAWARSHFRWVVMDATPVLPAADVADLLPQADCVLLVVRAASTPRELAKRTIEILGKRLHGVILNEATIDSNPYYRHLSKAYGMSGTEQFGG